MANASMAVAGGTINCKFGQGRSPRRRNVSMVSLDSKDAVAYGKIAFHSRSDVYGAYRYHPVMLLLPELHTGAIKHIWCL